MVAKMGKHKSEIIVSYRVFNYLCKKNGLSFTKAAQLAGANHTEIWRWEKGQIQIGVRNLYKIAKFFDVPMEAFIVERKVTTDEEEGD